MIFGLYICQYLGSDIMLQFCKMLPLGETRQNVQKILLHYFLQLHVKLQSSHITNNL